MEYQDQIQQQEKQENKVDLIQKNNESSAVQCNLVGQTQQKQQNKLMSTYDQLCQLKQFNSKASQFNRKHQFKRALRQYTEVISKLQTQTTQPKVSNEIIKMLYRYKSYSKTLLQMEEYINSNFDFEQSFVQDKIVRFRIHFKQLNNKQKQISKVCNQLLQKKIIQLQKEKQFYIQHYGTLNKQFAVNQFQLAYCFYIKGSMTQACYSAKKSLQIQTKINLFKSNFFIGCLFILFLAYKQKNCFIQALQYYQKCIKFISTHFAQTQKYLVIIYSFWRKVINVNFKRQLELTWLVQKLFKIQKIINVDSTLLNKIKFKISKRNFVFKQARKLRKVCRLIPKNELILRINNGKKSFCQRDTDYMKNLKRIFKDLFQYYARKSDKQF